MPRIDLDLQRSVQTVAEAYERHAERTREDGYRSVWSSIANKAQSDRLQSELSGVVDLSSYLPSWRVRALLRRVGYFGERIGYLAGQC